MRQKTMLIVAVGVVLAGGMTFEIGHARGTSRANDGVASSAKEERPRLELVLPAELFAFDQPIDFRTVVHNPTPDPLTVWTSGYWPNHLVLLLAEDGSESPITGDGKFRKRAFFSGDRTKNFPTRIPAGRSHGDGEHRLTDLYLLGPGTYQMKVLYSDDQDDTTGPVHHRKEVSLLSNVVKFRVKAPPVKH